MATIGNVSTSLARGTIETTLALANFNFDFAICKVDAPKEFEGVGSALSPFRRTEAETGSAHATARRLRALFDGVLPPIPSLAKAYGRRASEVSSSLAGVKSSPSHGIFASQTGADATSIWAAATSGDGAIRVHLLACMLARIWDASEATSIWVELVDERKREITATFKDPNVVDLAAYMSAQQIITRTQLAEWDASARAWLRVADLANQRRQKQLELIVSNVTAAVNQKPSLYHSVMQAWKVALEGMECLINGMPQQMQTGELLLGLSAWHLYPDMIVLDESTTNVSQKDPLVRQGGVLTIGLKRKDTDPEKGVYWSLPLALLRYYGDPVLTSRSTAVDGSRLSIEEFGQALLGCLISGWDVRDKDYEAAMTWIIELLDNLNDAAVAYPESSKLVDAYRHSFLGILAYASRRFLESEGNSRQVFKRLHVLGKGYTEFLGRPNVPFFGFGGYKNLLDLHEDVEDKIRVLRDFAEKLNVLCGDVFIRYKRSISQETGWAEFVYEYTTAIPYGRQAVKRTNSKSQKTTGGHVRWSYSGGGTSDHPEQISEDTLLSAMRDASGLEPWNNLEISFENHSSGGRVSEFAANQNSILRAEYPTRVRDFALRGEEMFPLDQQHMKERLEEQLPQGIRVEWDRQPKAIMTKFDGGTPSFEFLWGDMDVAALFIHCPPGKASLDSILVPEMLTSDIVVNLSKPQSKSQQGTGSFEYHQLQGLRSHCGLSEVRSLMATRRYKAQTLIQVLNSGLSQLGRDYMRSLQALGSIAQAYKLCPEATISLLVLQQNLYKAQWIPIPRRVDPMSRTCFHDIATFRFESFKLSRIETFACLVMFESGYHNLDPSQLGNVMAMSACDSIFVAAPLLCDPFEVPESQEIHRIMGNIGRPGIALLVPPAAPRIKAHDINTWNLINDIEFDGQLRDCFQGTSLHLSFTGSSLPLDVGYSGRQDAEVYLLESVVSVHERGEWVADLDILKALGDHQLLIRRDDLHCPYVAEELAAPCEPTKERIVSLQSWTEFLERPPHRSIFQAHNNWQARLAATAVSIAQGHKAILLPKTVCLDRVDEHFEEHPLMGLTGGSYTIIC